MAENETTNSNEAGQFSVLTQYIRDLSFESPNAPEVLRSTGQSPAIDIGINVNANPLSEDNYDVTLSLSAKAGEGKDMLFHIEVVYGGVFLVKNIPQEHLMPLLFVECPRLLFPFARQVVADITRNGGFPPLMIDPIDFLGLFQKRIAEQQAAEQTPIN